jgi:hypothetical protein
MDWLVILGRTLAFSLAAGVNLYATIALIGLASRFGWVSLPPEYGVFNNDWIIGIAILLYAGEFLADKIPWVDTAWDAVHTFVRPIGGAAVAVATLGDASPAAKVVVGLIGGTVAAGSHITKAGTRVVANTSPEPFSNWILSLLEDGFVIGLGMLALKYPLAALVISVLVIVAIAVVGATLIRAFRRRFRSPVPPPPSPQPSSWVKSPFPYAPLPYSPSTSRTCLHLRLGLDSACCAIAPPAAGRNRDSDVFAFLVLPFRIGCCLSGNHRFGGTDRSPRSADSHAATGSTAPERAVIPSQDRHAAPAAEVPH